MFVPNLKCQIQKASESTDVYGMPIPGVKKNELMAIVEMRMMAVKSSVRADSSASRGNAQEIECDARFLLTTKTVAAINDILIFGSHKFRIVSIFPRHDVQGRLDHFEVTCNYWSQK